MRQHFTGQTNGYAFNTLTGPIVAESQGTAPGHLELSQFGPDVDFGWGLWVQWETHYKPNTGGSGNGFLRVYRNGVLFWELVNVNLNGSINMNGMDVEAGGVYTKAIWRRADNSCSTFIGDGLPVGLCSDFTNCACPPNPPIFKRSIDDVIVLKK